MSGFSPSLLGHDAARRVIEEVGRTLEEPGLYPLVLGAQRQIMLCIKLEACGETLMRRLYSRALAAAGAPPWISLPVLASMYLAGGAALPPRLKAKAARAARYDVPARQALACDPDHPAGLERADAMWCFAEMVEQHRPDGPLPVTWRPARAEALLTPVDP